MKNLKIALIPAFLTLIITVFAACGSKTTEINAQELCKITVSGYNGYATASAEPDTEKINKFCDEKLLKSKDELKKYLNGVSVDVDCADSENGKLSNETELTITLDINDETAQKYGVKVLTNPFTYKVENLAEPTVIDVFDGLELSYKGIAPYLTSVDFVTDSCTSPYKEITYVPVTASDEPANKFFGLKNGDKITVKAILDQEKAAQNGYLVEELSKEYEISGASEYVTALDGFDLTDIEKEMEEKMKAEAEAEYWAELSQSNVSTSQKVVSKYFLDSIEKPTGSSLVPENKYILFYEVTASDGAAQQVRYYAITVNDVHTNENGQLTKTDSTEYLASYKSMENALKSEISEKYKSFEIM